MSRGKTAFICICLAITALSVWAYFSQGFNKGQSSNSTVAPKATMIGYDIYKYRGENVIARASGQKATFIDAGRLLCEGGTKMVRIRGGQREEVSSVEATIVFPADTKLASKNANAQEIELRNDVEMIRGDSRFTTEWLNYSDKTKEATTDRQVRIEQNGQFIAAEQGMTYNMQTESIRMRGGVFGSVKSNVVDNMDNKEKGGQSGNDKK